MGQPEDRYKEVERYHATGAVGLQDRGAPRESSCHLSGATAKLMGLRERHPRWGAKKLLAVESRMAVPVDGGAVLEGSGVGSRAPALAGHRWSFSRCGGRSPAQTRSGRRITKASFSPAIIVTVIR